MSEPVERSEGSDFRARVAEYVLGLLNPREHEAVKAQIAASPALQAEESFWLDHFSPLDDHVEPVTPPGQLYASIERRLFGSQKRVGWWDNLVLWRGVAAGALCVAAAAVGFSILQPRPDSAALATQLVAALQAEGSDVQFLALYDGEGAVRLTALSGDVVPGSDYELWAIQGGGSPISMGLVPVNARTTVELSDAVRAGWGEGSVLAITLEPEGGAPQGVPTGPIVASGAVTQI